MYLFIFFNLFLILIFSNSLIHYFLFLFFFFCIPRFCFQYCCIRFLSSPSSSSNFKTNLFQIFFFSSICGLFFYSCCWFFFFYIFFVYCLQKKSIHIYLWKPPHKHTRTHFVIPPHDILDFDPDFCWVSGSWMIYFFNFNNEFSKMKENSLKTFRHFFQLLFKYFLCCVFRNKKLHWVLFWFGNVFWEFL